MPRAAPTRPRIARGAAHHHCDAAGERRRTTLPRHGTLIAAPHARGACAPVIVKAMVAAVAAVCYALGLCCG